MARRESDRCIVPQQLDDSSSETKPGNAGEGKASKLSREQVVPPTAPSGEPLVPSRLERITNRAEQHPEETFNNLFTLLNVELLRMAFERLERNKAPGIDGRTVKDYEANLESNLRDLEQRLHRGTYRPLPSLRHEIPKGDGKTRPLGIAAVEDKLVQRAVVMILERIYEVDFSESSFGFRPGRSCHDALGVLGKIIATKKVNWISDADIKGFFDNVNHEQLLELLRTRIGDPRMLRLIERFLKAGVMIEGRRHETDDGVPQGAVLSPLLANVYLHYVLDQWFERDVKPRLKGQAYLVRYADDFICAFENESDAKRFQEVLVKRLARYSLELALEKTKLLRFGRFAERDTARLGAGQPGVFDFLGFTHYCGHSRAGKFKLKRRTSKKKMRTKVRDMKDWFRSQLTVPIAEVWPILNAKLRGHYQYYGINDNWPQLMKYQRLVERLSFRWMRRRSHKGKTHSWSNFRAFVKQHPLALPRKLTDLIALHR
jgi:group II intron reverse transcriptase/maturase